MSMRGTLANSASQPCIISMAFMMLVMVPFQTLIGCTAEGKGNSAMSSLSTRAGATAAPSLDLVDGNTEADQAGPMPLSLPSTGATNSTSDLTPDSLYTDDLPNSSDDVPMIAVTSTPMGVTVRLNWEHPSDTNTFGYHVYYGKQPAQEAGSCVNYEANQAVDAPPATIAGLEHDTIYYFAVKHFNDSEDACSEEIMVATPSAHT